MSLRKKTSLLLFGMSLLVVSGLLLRAYVPVPSAPEEMLLTVYLHAEQRSCQMALETYVLHATAAEMPANYAPEALKCQAVAARTRAAAQCRLLSGSGCKRHPDCDICTDSTCCQGYLDDDALRERWGGSYPQLFARVSQAVQQTRGLILCFEGMPIEMLYHASSGGRTEDSAAVFSTQLPYLVSVDSPGEEGYRGYTADTTFSCDDAAALLLSAFPNCGITADTLPSALRLQTSTASGRVATLLVGNQVVSGSDFRRVLGLRSTYITWESHGDTLTFHTTGYGHGVGLSQAGAQAMAADGAGFRDILLHYYPGTQLASME